MLDDVILAYYINQEDTIGLIPGFSNKLLEKIQDHILTYPMYSNTTIMWNPKQERLNIYRFQELIKNMILYLKWERNQTKFK
jgi:hypothetical protein